MLMKLKWKKNKFTWDKKLTTTLTLKNVCYITFFLIILEPEKTANFFAMAPLANFHQPRSTTQIWVVTYHQDGIFALIPGMSFCRGPVVKSQNVGYFPQANYTSTNLPGKIILLSPNFIFLCSETVFGYSNLEVQVYKFNWCML